jgi:hypothetical protein
MRVNVAIPEEHVDAPVLNAALEATTRLNQSMLRAQEIPSFERGLKYGIRWRPEPPGDEHFDHAKMVMGRKWGDCDDLAPWHAASLRNSGEDKQAKAIVVKSGPKRWHAVVKRGDGRIDDPSKRAGMGPHVQPGHRGATSPLMAPPSAVVGGAYIMRPQLALRPHNGAWQSRADIPWHWQKGPHDPITPGNIAMATLHRAPLASTALNGAIDGAIELALEGEYAAEEHVNRLCCINDAIDGADWDELAHIYGEEDADAASQLVGSFFGSIAHLAQKALPLVSKGLQFVPGVGPIASTALDFARANLPSGEAHAAQAATLPANAAAIQHIASPLSHDGMQRICFPTGPAHFG